MNEHEAAMDLARQVHEMAGANQTFLFGSRARGDHRPDSDVDVAIILNSPPSEDALKAVRSEARRLQLQQLPGSSGIDVFSMTLEEFGRGATLRNHIANTILKQGSRLYPGRSSGWPTASRRPTGRTLRPGCGTPWDTRETWSWTWFESPRTLDR